MENRWKTDKNILDRNPISYPENLHELSLNYKAVVASQEKKNIKKYLRPYANDILVKSAVKQLFSWVCPNFFPR